MKNLWLVMKLCELAAWIGSVNIEIVPREAPSLDIDEEQLFKEDVCEIVNLAYSVIPGFKSCIPSEDGVRVHITDPHLLKYFPREIMDLPIEFVLNGIFLGEGHICGEDDDLEET